MALSKVTRNYQVTIPRDIRELEDLHIGDKVLFIIEGPHRIHVMKYDKDIISKTAGLWNGMKETGVEYVRRIRKEWEPREKRLQKGLR
jgi:AbrB family looped-hinge helix DNA binding protein